MIREQRDLLTDEPVRVSAAVDPLVMVSHDRGNLRVRVDVGADPLADLRVKLHLPALFERQGARLLEETSRKPDLPDVVHEPADMRKLLLLLGQPHSGSDITCVHRDCARMTCGVSIPGVKSRDESRCEGEVSSLKG